MLSGVTSTNSSFPMNSIDCSKVNVVTGTNLTASSEPEALVFVNFLPLQTLISKSSALAHYPTTIPWYTGVPGVMNNLPLSWALNNP